MCQITLDLEQKLVMKEYFISETKHIYPLGPGRIMQYQPGPSLELSGADAYGQYIHVQLNKRIVKTSVNIAILDLGLRDSL